MMHGNESFTCRDGHMQRAELAQGSSETVPQEATVRFIQQRVTSSSRRGGEGNVAVRWIRGKKFSASEAIIC